ncbi:hypothetical protein A1353_02475 [Methylomonas methanica]|uniref:Uncharacterized protein n=1 Tax=Methylomonas methanica TaxID=421 RepID=A0A177LYZ8_METMH|nr:hypothetical protein A1353_02475 [Methylomonas methanica]
MFVTNFKVYPMTWLNRKIISIVSESKNRLIRLSAAMLINVSLKANVGWSLLAIAAQTTVIAGRLKALARISNEIPAVSS